MTWLTRVTAVLLRYAAGVLRSDRQVWAHALWAEADEVPEGLPRLAWLAGWTRLTVREAALGRRLGYSLAFAAAAAGTAWSAWSGPPGVPAIVINRVDVIAIAVILAGLPWAVRRARPPSRPASRQATACPGCQQAVGSSRAEKRSDANRRQILDLSASPASSRDRSTSFRVAMLGLPCEPRLPTPPLGSCCS